LTAALPTTLSETWKRVSAPEAVTERVSGEAGEAEITYWLPLVAKTDAPHTALLYVIELICTFASVVICIRNVLIEYVPAYADTLAVNELLR